ncbi:MAG TPA: hypothetical protein DCY06_11485 [Bacteroidetes bacterium]|nr:hypothetical protein [Bacteroidota bacterium]HCN37381.1 hypothetical protein [Bacteroidota bacterium]HRF67526.1 hypothetical protein [Ignavibacteria bacterium]HRJ84661.1 hypothetical protein [Ignavibacteria bacterium]
MPEYTKYKRGSEWRKWDLHIHTPETKKNDQFAGSTIAEKWDNFIKAINSSSEEISVIGITDYFCIDNYFKVKQLVAENTITKKFDLIIPNIEIRVLPVGGSGTPINLHCIFNPNIDTEIETRFLSKLKFNYSDADYSAKKEELIRLGRDFTGNSSLNNSDALKAGIGQYVISMDVLREVFEKDIKLRENTIIIVSNKSTDGVTGIVKHSDFFIDKNVSQLEATRRSIYQFSDAIFSSNPSDILYFSGLGVDSKKTVIEKCASLMPCFHGSDAHKNENIFNPAESRFCWIKADPTFEGLKQTLYEPNDRVKIQALKPDVKNERYIISELEFIDTGNLFGNQKILLNENLNAIIGGKSSGKSLLLYSTARSIDPEQVDKADKRLDFDGYKFKSEYDFKVTWKNGDVDRLNDNQPSHKLHKITYIPQLYINYLVEKNNKEDLNSLIKNIILQDSAFKKFFESRTDSILETTSEIERLLNEFLQVRQKGNETFQKSKQLGTSENIKKGLTKIENDIELGRKSSNLTEEEFREFNRLQLEKSELEKSLREIDLKDKALSKILDELIKTKANLLGNEDEEGEIDKVLLKGQIDRILQESSVITPDLVLIRDKIGSDFNTMIANLVSEIKKLNLETVEKQIIEKIGVNKIAINPYLIKLEGQKELQKLTSSLEVEKLKHQQSQELERQIESFKKEHENIRKQISILLNKRYKLYKEIEKEVNDTKNDIGSEILLSCTLIYKEIDFPFFEQVNKASISSDHYFNTLFSKGNVNYGLIPILFEKPLKVIDDKLYFETNKYFPIKLKTDFEDILRGLIKDSFNLDYSVTYKGDDLLSMSPGKKGTVLLILFLHISSFEYPILIDQPEDNLDNRTIYDLLCQMIKEKKKDRQIIIVSHNANLVVATDTENIIVANQEGEGVVVRAGRYKFEYINGSIEHSFAKNDGIAEILLSQGIKEHVCDILEGGNEAFKQRERKYSIK